MRFINYTIYLLADTLRRWGVNFHEATDSRVMEMKKEISKLGGKIEFKIEHHPDGQWVAESSNLDGIITGGKATQEVSSTIRDAIFTYFNIPPHLCNAALLRADNEPVTTTQRVYV